MARAQPHFDLPGRHETWKQAELNHRRLRRLFACPSSKPDSFHPHHATLNSTRAFFPDTLIGEAGLDSLI
jgi:hypothetical protein